MEHSLKEKPALAGITEIQMAALEKEMERTGITMAAVLERYGIREPVRITSNYMAVVPAHTLFKIEVETATRMTVVFIVCSIFFASFTKASAIV